MEGQEKIVVLKQRPAVAVTSAIQRHFLGVT